jgi:DNA-binding NtrC family response regulator
MKPRQFIVSKEPVARILIVDDEPTILRSFGWVLESEGYEVTTAVSATDATQKLTVQSFDIVITDVRMETPTAGFDVVRAVRRSLPATPVALLTAFPLLTADWERAGADALFSKGADVEAILKWIRACLAAASAKSEKRPGETEQARKQAG